MSSDQELLATVIWAEARGEGHCGMVAVGLVIWNRHLAWRKTIQDVILGKNQFSSFNNGIPAVPPNDPTYPDCLNIAAQILTGKVADITNGSCYYANLETANSAWFTDTIVSDKSEHPMTAKIKSHTFFR